MRQWVYDFAIDQYMQGRRPEWFWDWLSNVTFDYDEATRKGDDDLEIPF